MQNFKAEVDLAIKAPDSQNLEKTLSSILEMVDRIPASGKAGSAAFKEILDQVNGIKTSLASGVSVNGLSSELKALSGTLKNLSTLSKTLELFSNKDIENVNKATTAIRQAAKAYEDIQRNSQIQKGTFGLDQTKLSEITKAAKSLQQELNAVKQTMQAVSQGEKPKVSTNDPLFQRGLLLEKNLATLKVYEAEVQRGIALERKAAEELKKAAAEKKAADAEALRLKRQADAELLRLKRQAEAEDRAAAKRQAAEEAKRAAQAEKARVEEAKRKDSLNDGRVLAANNTTGFARSPTGQAAFVNQGALKDLKTSLLADPAVAQLKAANELLALKNAQNKAALEAQGITTRDLGKSQEQIALAQKLRKLKDELTEEAKKNNIHSERAVQLAKEIKAVNADRRILTSKENQDDPRLKQAAEQNRIDSMLSRTTGAGGAALLRVQLALMANYSIIQTVMTGIQAGITTAIELEAAFRNIQAVTATTKTEMVGLEQAIKDTASSSKFTALEVAEAALILGQAGLSAKQTADALPSVIVLATAAGTSLANAVDLVTSIVGVFDKQASDTADVANKVTAASNSSKISVEKLGLAFQYVGNTAAQTGVTFEETTAALATMSNAGIKSGSTLGTGLRQFLTEVQKPSKEFLESLNRVGLSLTDIDIRAHGLTGVISNLKNAGFAAREAIGAFDVRGAAAFNALVANPEMLTQQYQMLQNTQAAYKANEIQMNSLKSQAAQLTTSLSILVADGFGPIQTVLTGLARAGVQVTQVLGAYPGMIKAIVTGTAVFISLRLGAHFAGIGVGMLTAGGSASKFTQSLAGLTTVTIAQAGAATRSAVANLSMGTTIAGVGTASAVATPRVLTLTGAVTALKTAAGGLTIFGVLTGALTLGVAAWALLSGTMDTVTSSAEKLKVKEEEIKTVLKEKEANIFSVTKALEDLAYKQGSLTTGSTELNAVTNDLNTRFGALGVRLNSTNTSYEEMVRQLKRVKAEEEAIANLKRTDQIGVLKERVKVEGNQLQSTVKDEGLKGELELLMKLLRKADKNPDTSLGEKASMVTTLAALGKATKGEALNPEITRELLKLPEVLETLSKRLTSSEDLSSLKLGVNRTRKISNQAGDVVTAGLELGGVTAARDRGNSYQNFLGQKLFNGKTFEEASPILQDFDQLARKNTAKKGSDSPENYKIEKAKVAKGFIQVEVTKAEELLEGLATANISEEDRSQAKIKVQGQLGNLKRAWTDIYKTVEDDVKEYVEAQVKINEAILSNADDRKDSSKLEYRKQVARSQGELKSFGATFGAIGSDESRRAKSRYELDIANTKAANMTTRGSGGGGSQREKDKLEQNEFAAEAARLREEARVLLEQSKNKKLDAANATGLEEMNKLFDEYIELLVASKYKDVEALVAAQKAKVLPKNQTAKIKKENNLELSAAGKLVAQKQAVAEEGRGKIEGRVIAQKIARDITEQNKQVEVEIQRARLNTQLSLLEAQDELQKIQEEIAAGNRPDGIVGIKPTSGKKATKDTSETFGSKGAKAVKGNLEEKKAQMKVDLLEIEGIDKELLVLAPLLTQLKQTMVDMNEALAKAKADLAIAVAAGNKDDEADAQARVDLYQKGSTEATGNFIDKSLKRGGLNKAKGDLETKVAGLQASIPEQVNWENLTKAMDNALAKYQQTVASFDEVGTIGAGIEGTLNGLTGSFSNLFTNLVTQSMSASQAFKQFAVSIIKSMLDIINQALAMAAIKAILKAMGLGSGAEMTVSDTAISSQTIDFSSAPTFSSGGAVTGGTPGRDSVPLVAMPGEFVLQKSAVDALGMDFVSGLNQQTEGTIGKAAASTPSKSSAKASNEVTNIWVVTPDQKPSMGPRDVLITVADSLNQQGSPIKTLVKQIASGNM